MQLFGIYSSLSLFSNFTYFLANPGHGDQFNQRERRVVGGGNASHAQQVYALGVSHLVTVGVQSRTDLLSPVGLYHTRDRVRVATTRQDDVTESGSGVYLAADSRWRDWFRTSFGVRGDAYTFHVTSDRAGNSGDRSAAIVSPKASLIFAPTARTELYVSGGLGFHSNDARGTTVTVDPAERVNPLVR